MVEVSCALTGRVIGEWNWENGTVKDLKRSLVARNLARSSRFQLRLLDADCRILDDEEILNLEVVQLLRMNFVESDLKEEKEIIAACMENRYVLLEQKLNAPRNPNFADEHDLTPLYVAARQGNEECVKLLLEAGADTDRKCKIAGETPLFIAAENGHLFIVKYLVHCGANRHLGTTDDGATPLFIATMNGHLEVVRFLVEWFANIDQGLNENGQKPLFIAAANGQLEVVRFLLECGANIDEGTTDIGETPLFIAAANGQLQVVRFLVQSGADQKQGTRNNGTTPLAAARRYGHRDVVEFLVKSLRSGNSEVSVDKRARHYR